jgi:hypothetical protein
MDIIHIKFIIQQLEYDLIGKDSYRGVTLTYAWLANQFGHIALGFIPTILIYQILKSYIKSSQLNIYTAFLVTFIWFFFESYNFLGPLFKSNQSYNFKPDLINVGFDTITDVCFFAVGAFIAAIIIQYSFSLLLLNSFFCYF